MSFLYLSLLEDKKLVCYRIDDTSGALTYLHETSVPGEPSVQGTDPGCRILYAAMRSTGQLLSFKIDPVDGSLDLLNTIDTGLEDPAYLKTDHTGRFLLTPYYASGKVTVYPIGADGAAYEPAISIVDTAPHAHGIAIDATNRFVFVPHTWPGNGIWQFILDEGRLVPNSPPHMVYGEKTGPRHAHFHPNETVVYAINEQDVSVTIYAYDQKNGTLRPEKTHSTLPVGYSGNKGACSRLALHPSGRFLYAANRGPDNIAIFKIDAVTGGLTPVGHAPTEANPRSFDMDPSGRFLYAAGQSADKISVYQINQETGDLDKSCVYDTGRVPWWVHVIEPGS